jgi:hypothetical protein
MHSGLQEWELPFVNEIHRNRRDARNADLLMEASFPPPERWQDAFEWEIHQNNMREMARERGFTLTPEFLARGRPRLPVSSLAWPVHVYPDHGRQTHHDFCKSAIRDTIDAMDNLLAKYDEPIGTVIREPERSIKHKMVDEGQGLQYTIKGFEIDYTHMKPTKPLAFMGVYRGSYHTAS